MECLVKNCDNKRIYEKYCSKHYRRWKKYGNPLTKINTKGKSYEELYGEKRAKQIKKNLSKLMKARNWTDENSPNWKGDNVGYYGLHWWARKHIPKTKLCAHCKLKPPKHLANIPGTYKRNLNDWKWLCVKCHSKHDWKSKIIRPKRDCLICGTKVNQSKSTYCSRKCKGLGEKKFGKKYGRRELNSHRN